MTAGESYLGRRPWAYADRAYRERGLDAVFVIARMFNAIVIIVGLGLAMWVIGELEERGITSETQDALLTVTAIILVALIAGLLGRRLTSPWLELQEMRLREALDDERALRIQLEHELDVRQTFIEQANHHLRTPVTVVYGLAELIADHAEGMSATQQAMLQGVVVDNALALKEIIEDLSGFLDERVAALDAERKPGAAAPTGQSVSHVRLA